MKKLTEFNVGGAHSENSNGGIPQGINQTGTPNTVEEGETKYDDFIFSDRITVNKNLINQFNLPKYISDKSYSNASKAINNKFKDRSDKYSSNTKDALLLRLSNAQEYTKMQESLKANSTEVPDMMDGSIPEGFEEFIPQNQMFLGGLVNPLMGALSLGNQVQGNTSTNMGDAALNGVLTGASAGMGFGPLGAGVGALAGLGSGLLGNKKAKEKAKEQALNNAYMLNSQFSSDFAFGGPINPRFRTDLDVTTPVEPDLSGYTPTSKVYFANESTPFNQFLGEQDRIVESGNNNFEANPNILPKNTETNSAFGDVAKPVWDWTKNNYGNLLRLAPVVSNALQLKNMKKSPYERYNRLDNRYVPQYVDEQAMQNIVNTNFNNTTSQLAGASNGSMGALRSNILAANADRIKALSDTYLSASDRNRQQDQIAQQFNLNIDESNNRTDMLERDVNARNLAAYDTNRSKFISQIGTDLGNIGKEEVYKKLAKESFGYTWDGRYWNKPNGEKATDEEVKREMETLSTRKMNYGGYLKLYK